MKKIILTALSVVGAWCAQADHIAEIYRGDSTTPEYIDSSDGLNNIGMTSTRERVVLLKDVTLGVNNTPMWGCTEYCPEVTFDLNGHTVDASGYYCKYESGLGIVALCNLTFVDSVGTGKMSGQQVTCPKGVAVTFDLPLTTVVSSDTGYTSDYDPHGSGTKGSITINGGKFDGCVHGSGSAGTTLLTGGYFNKSKNSSITSYDSTKSRYFDNGDGYWRVVPITYAPSTITVPTVENATATVYTNGAGSVWCAVPTIGSNKYEVEFGSSVKVVYAAATDHVFAGGGTTYETKFVANEETITVTAPDAPIELSGVTVNGLDVSALYGTGWEVASARSGGYYTVALTESREFVLHGTNTGGYVRFDVTADKPSLIVSNLTLSGYGDYTRSGIYLDYGVDVDLTLKGLNAISGGANRPAIEVQYDASLAIGGDGSLAASHGEGADYIGRYTGETAGTISYSGGRYNFTMEKDQLAEGYVRETISETEGGYDFVCRVVPLGIKVNGVAIYSGSGSGWTFSNGTLALTEAKGYTITGTNRTGAVRVNVLANANVTLDNLELVCDSATVDLIRFGDNVTGTLTLSGVNTVYATNDFAAVQVAKGAVLTVDGTGELVGGRSGSHCGRGVCVYQYGTLNWNGGTLRDYYFRKSGSTTEKGAGVYTMDSSVFNMRGGRLVGMYGYDGGAVYTQGGTVNIYGGDIAGNTAVYGAALYCRGTINVYGGNVTNNTVTGGGIVCAGSGSIYVYGGVVNGNIGNYLYYRDYGNGYLYGAAGGTGLTNAVPVAGKSVVKITDALYVVGTNVTASAGALTGGTFTFNPTNAEYVAAGLSLADNREVVTQAGEPVTYRVRALLSTITPQTVAHATSKVYTNDVEVVGQSGAYVVVLGTTVKVVYTAETDYVFAGGGTTYETTFVANEETMAVPEDQLPDEPIHLSGVTVNGLDVSALYGTGWTVIKAGSGGYYTVQLNDSSREYVLHGTNTEGYVRFDVRSNVTGASLVVSNLVLSGYGENECSGIYLGYETSVNLTLKGLNAISGGKERPAIEVQYDAALAIDGDGSLAAFPGDDADPVGRYSDLTVGTIRYSGGRYNFEVPETQLVDGYVRATISETEGGYTFTCRVAPKLGVKVNGAEVALGSGEGWTFANGVLSLTNEMAYTLSGTNTAGAVRVAVTANANVTLSDLTLASTSESSLIDICASNVTLVVAGTNAIHAATNAVVVAADATLTIFGDGWLVGGAADDLTNSFVRVSGALAWKGGVLFDYAAGGIRCDAGGTVRILGGVFGNNGAYPNACEWLGAVGTDIGGVTPVAGSMVTNIMGEADLFAIGQDVASTTAGLTGGTFTFNPTGAVYVAAGVALADNREVVEQAGEPVTYQVRTILSTVVPQDVANATYAIFTNETVEVTNRPCVVAYGTTVKVVYTADDGYVFADGSTTATATFVADADVVEVPADQLPKAPVEANVRVTQASGEIVYAATFTNAMNVATNGATVALLADLANEAPKKIYMDFSYTLDGNGHSLGLKPFSGLLSFAVLSNDVVRMKNVTIDAQNATGILALVASGSLTLTNCCVTGFRMRGGALLASRDGDVTIVDTVFRGNDFGAGALAALVSTTNAAGDCLVKDVTMTNNVCGVAIISSNASGDPAKHQFGAATIGDNGGAAALATYDGVSVLASGFLDGNTAVIGRDSALAFDTEAPESLDLDVTSVASREGDILVTNLYDVAVDAAKVNVLNNGYTAWGEGGNVYLLSETNFLYAVQVKVEGEGEQWKVYRSFDEALASQPQPLTSTSLSLVHYRNVPNGHDIAVQGDDLSVGAGTNLTLRTVLRECVDGTNTTWNGTTTEMVSLTGTLTVSGVAKIENVVLAGKVVLSGGTLDIGAEYSTNGTPVVVELATTPESEEVAAITSSVYTGAQLLPHFSLKGDNLVFVIKENGLSVVKVEDKVARVGTVDYDTFSAAVADVPDEGLVEIIASSNAATAAHRDEVKFGTDVQVAADKNFLVKSIRTMLKDNVVIIDENPTVPVTLVLDGSKVTLGANSSMAFTNVAMKGTLELAGSGLLDFASFTGTMLVRPTHTGLIATNVADAAQLKLGTGASGVLYSKGTGVWWRDGSFSAKFVQTGNGVGRIDIDDYGVKSSVNVSDPVKSGRYDYHYTGPADQTGTDTNLSFGVVWCEVGTAEVSGSRIILPSSALYANGDQYPQYKTAGGDYVNFNLNSDGTWKTLPDLPTGEKDPKTHHSQATLSIRNYGANDVVIATFDIVATSDDAKDGLTDGYNSSDEGVRDALKQLESICSDIAKLGIDVLFIGGILTENFIGYTVSSWIDAVKGLISSLCHICADVYVDAGEESSDYYSRSDFDDACERAQKNGWSVHVMRSAKYKPYTLSGSKSLTIDAAACPNTDFAGLASCIIGTVVPGTELKKAVISWASNIALSFVEGFVEAEISERVPHGMMSDDGSKAMLTISSNASVTLTGMDASGLSDKDLASPVFDVAGSLTLKTADGLGKPNNRLSGFKSVSSAHGVVYVRSGGLVYLWDTVTANASNAKNFYVENGGLVLVEKSSGEDSRVGISGQTGNGDVFATTSRWPGGTTNDYAKVFSNDAKPENCTLGIDSSGNIFWVITPTVFYLDLNNIPHYATYDAAAADCAKAYVTRPNKAVEGVIGADAYNALFGVSVINDGTVSTPWTLQVDLTPSVSNEVQTAVDAALPSLVSTITNDVPTATVSTQAGLYYGLAGTTNVSEASSVAIETDAWTLGTGSAAQEVTGEKPEGATDKAFYQLRVIVLP